MSARIEIFAASKDVLSKVGCSTCVLKCASRDQVELTPEILKHQLEATYGADLMIELNTYDVGDASMIIDRMNQIYEDNDVKRRVNSVLIKPLMSRIWPLIVVDGKIISEGTLLDLNQIRNHIDTP
ncbi:hypothetical protein [Petrocella sp. FN5]|uniref:hypothetical protein n=1 Tax=Petrocella sp. FN5 TaxID=3032002 RepID=UPI0023DCD3AB|nr:hypothetical protein [Petrocella sp. FN5]MDF1618188.1 hypothetical protein [Petrocella sp. FN5]